MIRIIETPRNISARPNRVVALLVNIGVMGAHLSNAAMRARHNSTSTGGISHFILFLLPLYKFKAP